MGKGHSVDPSLLEKLTKILELMDKHRVNVVRMNDLEVVKSIHEPKAVDMKQTDTSDKDAPDLLPSTIDDLLEEIRDQQN